MINKIFWRKYTDSCSASVIILCSVTTPKNCNCTIMWQQHYFETVHGLNISRIVSPLFLMSAFSLSDIEPMRFYRVAKEIDLQDFWRRCSSAVSVFSSGLALNSGSHNAPNVFNRRQIWRIWRPISRWNVLSLIFAVPNNCLCIYDDPHTVM